LFVKSISEFLDLKGRVALVTGGAGHLGRIITETLAELGASVAILDFDPATKRVAGELREQTQQRVEPLVLDLVEKDSIKTVAASVQKLFGRLDILVNNAALCGAAGLNGWAVPFSEQSSAAWRRALEVNLTAPFRLSQTCARLLNASGRGVIVNIGSIYGLLGPDHGLYEDTNMHNPAAYGASKAGLLQLTRWLATTLAPNVRVNAISPGGIWRNQPKAFVERYTRRTPLNRMATEEDLKGAVAYLASDLSNYVTGHNLVVDGGWTAW
jgi:NAD(P)-dependent dehydrogenase (short-subunit alcohol dehydrogenase family)